MLKALLGRLWKSVQVTESCWLWTGALLDGYGIIGSNGTCLRVHRLTYEQLVGEIPQGLVLDHLCRVRNCVNPSHLEPVTIKENVLRGVGPTAEFARRDECAHGHLFTPENTRITKTRTTTYRRCLECHRARNRAYMSRKRQERKNAK
ncbi:hypothetical protein CIK76_05000 [Glutamicibacter sp. BW80]|nr:hypothetical protein CIK76_05000 [Glutamicibacter sp. BW80]